MNYYLKTNTKQELWEELESINLATRDYDMDDENNIRPEDADEDWEMSGAYDWRFTGIALDMIGTIYAETGNTLTDSDGNEYPEIEAIDGYHANLIADIGTDSDGNEYSEIEGLSTIDAPATPYRKWAGQ